ncbi:hypothetical protein [Ensifer canadensis]|uniref:hypothetical protein n=1 Tax=Ensifer canadensis TaxID=555315 RepID=UPI00046D2F23|nr:hypothetical protein [Ensifer canadensis]OMQ42116.1 hypothetical protein BKP54_25620 [Ensifer sp. 1H6]
MKGAMPQIARQPKIAGNHVIRRDFGPLTNLRAEIAVCDVDGHRREDVADKTDVGFISRQQKFDRKNDEFAGVGLRSKTLRNYGCAYRGEAIHAALRKDMPCNRQS